MLAKISPGYKGKTTLELDIARYNGYVEFAHRNLKDCSPRDKSRMRAIYVAYIEAYNALDLLQSVLNSRINKREDN